MIAGAFVAAVSAVGEVPPRLLRLESPTTLLLLRPQDQVTQWSQSRDEDCAGFREGCWSSVSVGSLETLVSRISKGAISRGSSINQLLHPGSQATEKALLRCVSCLSAYIRSINQGKSWFFPLSTSSWRLEVRVY